MQDSAISATVDFHLDGVQHGFLKLPYSHDQSAWGNVMIPVTVIGNGEGPTALLTGGNHGDEYEGITALLKLANRLQARDIRGRVIIVPMMNHPAVQNGTRTSPLDGGNLNRAFPGDPAGTLTEKIADYFTRYLVPLADVVLDMHSGGRTLDLLPFAATHRLADEAFGARCLAGAEAFGAPYTLFMAELEEAALFDSVVEAQGRVFISTELRGGGTTTPDTVALAEQGVDNVLRFAGILPGDPLPVTSQALEIPSADYYRVSEHRGLLEFAVALGDWVQQGEVLARVHSLDRTGQPPVDYRAPFAGMLIGRRHPARVDIGDTFAVLAVKR
ncbi:N-alpha-acetyl diaminobutyric acid deacetylase DoeB [Alcanivorax sp. VBW004]|uniref:N(2)-acetyl-L-2,4-diaminobutanoate deacetylase DoeB n=1 Tax=Alcanivorax sp. VBW004 TaxID=1287708 RepID=UPI0012BD0CE8|nr:N(2)-acetyl-L-2,4-diaminobutanoate deacetylase DoeB [Alcanivorax sp. VBW004]MTT50884.1 N-alpha-acetyl diaminobutyric acid deacetylase DoeB [Alcanivorax sp. VBW004]